METYKDHITLSPDMNEERLNTLKRLNDTSSVGLVNQQPSVMLLHQHELHCITMQSVVSMLTRLTISSLKAKTLKF